jgi:hypothetical protein
MRIHQRGGVIRVHNRRKGVERQRNTEFLERLIKSFFRKVGWRKIALPLIDRILSVPAWLRTLAPAFIE